VPMTYDDRRVIDDTRFSVMRSHINQWNLQVRQVRDDDAGRYRCTVNTSPVRSKVVYLHVRGNHFLPVVNNVFYRQHILRCNMPCPVYLIIQKSLIFIIHVA